MSVYHKFDDHDILYSVINASPKITMASGTHGWRGNVGTSSSLSLYEGVRSRTDVYNGSPSGISIFPLDPVDTNSIDKVIYVSGSYPSTGSVHFVKARRVPIPDGGTNNIYVTSDDWYEEHFNPVCGLFDYYSQYRTSFFTGSYDYYSLYMRQSTALTASNVWFSGSTLPTVSSSFALSMQIKPTVTGGLGRDFTLQSQFQKFKFYITGSTGQLAFSDYHTVVTSSAAVTLGRWQGVNVSVGGGSASFYINGALDSQVAFTGTLGNQTASFLRVGAEHMLTNGSSPSTFRSQSPVPMQLTAGGIAQVRVQTVPMFFPSDVSSTTLKASNRYYAGNAGSGATASFAMYKGNGAGKAGGSSLGDILSASVPGNGTMASIGSFPVQTDSNKQAVLLYSFDLNMSQWTSTPSSDLGDYHIGTQTVDPAPPMDGTNANPNFWYVFEYQTSKRKIVVLGDSIANGYHTTAVVGYTGSAWNQIMSSSDYAVCINAVTSYGSYQNFASSGTYPYMWDQISDIMNGNEVVLQLGTNDLNYTNATTMLGYFQTVLSGCLSRGASNVYAWTVPPQTGYTDINGARVTWNAYLKNNYVALGLKGIYDAATYQASGGLASNTDLTIMYANFSASEDGTHPNLAGQSQMKTGWLATIGTASQSSVSTIGNGFVGFMFESRIWNTQRTTTQISSSWNQTMLASSSAGLVHYARFNDGPLSTRHGYAKGSGAFDYSPTAVHGQFMNMGSNGAVTNVPLWQPNDNRTFVTYNTRIDDEVDMFRVLHVPSMFYGRQIATGSIRLECMAYSNQGLKRVIMDDGHGSLYLSGSICRDIGGEDYTGVMWRKVGNVFYTEGLVVITDPSLLDFGTTFLDTATPTDTLQVNFRGLERISTRTFQCRVPAAEANASNNPTFAKLNPSTGRYELTRDDGTTWITAVGLYNEDRKLIAVAKLAQPIRKREKDKLNIRLRFDY